MFNNKDVGKTQVNHIIVVGGTSSIAQHCIRQWLTQSEAKVTLIGRSQDRLSRTADDLRCRFPHADINTLCSNLLSASHINDTVRALCAEGIPRIVLIAQGNLPNQEECQSQLSTCEEALVVNALSPSLWAEAFTQKMIAAESTVHLAIIGSVAGDRGRQSNYIYGASKGLIERHAQGLQHRIALEKSKLRVTLVKPGPTATPMTAHLIESGTKLATPESVAAIIVSGIAKGDSVVYAPKRWRLIMMIIRHLPAFVFNKMRI